MIRSGQAQSHASCQRVMASCPTVNIANQIKPETAVQLVPPFTDLRRLIEARR